MFRRLLVVTGLVELLAPKRLIQFAQGMALENPDDCRMQSWVVPVARLEGVVFLLLALENDGAYAAFKKALVMIGMTALLAPRTLIWSGTAIAYEEPTACEWKPWVYPFARLVGIGYVLVGVSSLRRESAEEAS
jgi:hypothetical protein